MGGDIRLRISGEFISGHIARLCFQVRAQLTIFPMSSRLLKMPTAVEQFQVDGRQLLKNVAAAHNLRALLRYLNTCGADPDGRRTCKNASCGA